MSKIRAVSLSTTLDSATSDRDPSACRLPAPDLQTRTQPLQFLRLASRDLVTHDARARHFDCNKRARHLLPGCLVCYLPDCSLEGSCRNGGWETPTGAIAR
jgi:hypothetical protein